MRCCRRSFSNTSASPTMTRAMPGFFSPNCSNKPHELARALDRIRLAFAQLVDQAKHRLLDEFDQTLEHLGLAGEVAVESSLADRQPGRQGRKWSRVRRRAAPAWWPGPAGSGPGARPAWVACGRHFLSLQPPRKRLRRTRCPWKWKRWSSWVNQVRWCSASGRVAGPWCLIPQTILAQPRPAPGPLQTPPARAIHARSPRRTGAAGSGGRARFPRQSASPSPLPSATIPGSR